MVRSGARRPSREATGLIILRAVVRPPVGNDLSRPRLQAGRLPTASKSIPDSSQIRMSLGKPRQSAGGPFFGSAAPKSSSLALRGRNSLIAGLILRRGRSRQGPAQRRRCGNREVLEVDLDHMEPPPSFLSQLPALGHSGSNSDGAPRQNDEDK